jgi:UDP-glucose 4-epimerase
MVHVVTGGAGFIGSHLVNALIQRGQEVVVFDNLVRGRLSHLERAIESGYCVFVETDCSDFAAFRCAAQAALADRGGEAIWHLAANSDIPAGVADPNIDLRDTFMTTFNSLLIMRELDISQIHFASSSAVYGDFGELAITEQSAPYKPISNYGAMKLASEAQISAALEAYGKKASIFRFPNVVGAPATHGVIYDFVHKLKADPSRLDVLGNGLQQKAYLHVTELIDAMLFIAENGTEKVNIFNIGPKDAGISVRQIAEYVRDAVSPAAQITYGASDRGWVGDVPRFRYAIERLQQLGWQPSMDSEAAVRRAVHEISRDAA